MRPMRGGRPGHIELGVPAAIVALLIAVMLFEGWALFPGWVRALLLAVGVLAGAFAVVSMATPSWPGRGVDPDA